MEKVGLGRAERFWEKSIRLILIEFIPRTWNPIKVLPRWPSWSEQSRFSLPKTYALCGWESRLLGYQRPSILGRRSQHKLEFWPKTFGIVQHQNLFSSVLLFFLFFFFQDGHLEASRVDLRYQRVATKGLDANTKKENRKNWGRKEIHYIGSQVLFYFLEKGFRRWGCGAIVIPPFCRCCFVLLSLGLKLNCFRRAIGFCSIPVVFAGLLL